MALYAYAGIQMLSSVGITPGSSPVFTKLSISPNVTEPKITLWDGGNSGNHYGFGVSGSQLNYHVDHAGASHVFYAGGKNGNGTEVMRVTGDGRLFVSNLSFFDSGNMQYDSGTNEVGFDNSSRRYKENITQLTADFKRLLLAEPKTYTRPGREGKWELGFIAEEFDELGLKPLVWYDVEGRPDGIHYDKMVTYIVPILKEQQATIEAQQAELALLKSQLKERENAVSELSNRLETQAAQIERISAALQGAGIGLER